MPEDTIVAIATPPGRGGLGVVRLSGGLSFGILWDLLGQPDSLPEPRHAALAQFTDPTTRAKLDQVIVIRFARPHSYTGEDVVEISCHGAPVILRYLVECCLAKGARPAEPGEFTMRAFLNGRVDLTQAEAVRDLIDSRTLFQARVAAQQMGGSVSARVKPCKAALVNLIAALEAGIDFAEDDTPVTSREEIAAGIERVEAELRGMSQGYSYGRFIREGLSMAIAGRPNVGKSSLFNRLLDEERAIVTEIPGTTRDLVTETASLNGIPVRLVDTAGIREGADVVEKLGVARSFQAAADSDVRLLVLDSAQGITEGDVELFEKISRHGPLLIACNKCDLPSRLTPEDIKPLTTELPGQPDEASGGTGRVEAAWVSALTGEGLTELKEKLFTVVAPARDFNPEGEFITNLRHQQSIEQALGSLGKARVAAGCGVPHEMLLLDLYDALRALDTLTGATTVDDLLGVIFSTFCVGK
ncbi:MAG: tRNA uridine-5-carboxymethylaminomethyl(34) synthesis GTPase MnmE [Terriglobia bacterium]